MFQEVLSLDVIPQNQKNIDSERQNRDDSNTLYEQPLVARIDEHCGLV
jgi:hypothetical protein